MSTFKVEIVPVTLLDHPNADSLSVVEVWGFTCCVRTADWMGEDGEQNVDRGAYIPPDSLVDPDVPEFAFLKGKEKEVYGGKARVRVARLRGVISQGILLPVRYPMTVGTDVSETLGVTHYEPPVKEPGGNGKSKGWDDVPPPELAAGLTKYDIENWRRYGGVFDDGELVVVTEKIHGANGRFVFTEDKMWAGSRKTWKAEDRNSSLWWRALDKHPEVEEFCREYPGTVVYGEVYGSVQDLRYGHAPGAVSLAVFDILVGSKWLDSAVARELGNKLPWVPLLYEGRYDREKILELSEGRSTVPGADNVREGVVVKPAVERADLSVGRVQLKVVGDGYMLKQK